MNACLWYLVEGQELYNEDDFEEDLYQDRNYDKYYFPCHWEESDVWEILNNPGEQHV